MARLERPGELLRSREPRLGRPCRRFGRRDQVARPFDLRARRPSRTRWRTGPTLTGAFGVGITRAGGWRRFGEAAACTRVVDRPPAVTVFPIQRLGCGEVEVGSFRARAAEPYIFFGFDQRETFSGGFFVARGFEIGRFGRDQEDLSVRPLVEVEQPLNCARREAV